MGETTKQIKDTTKMRKVFTREEIITANNHYYGIGTEAKGIDATARTIGVSQAALTRILFLSRRSFEKYLNEGDNNGN